MRKNDNSITMTLAESAVFDSEWTAANAARSRGWIVWEGFDPDGTTKIVGVQCPRDASFN